MIFDRDFSRNKLFVFATLTGRQTYIPSTGEYLATLPGSLKKFPSKFVTLPPHNGAHEPSLKPFKSQTPFRGAPRIHSKSDAFVPRFLSRYVNAHTCVRECRSLFYRFFPTPPRPSSFSGVSKSLDPIIGEHLFSVGYNVHCTK